VKTKKIILVTGVADFIEFHLAKMLIKLSCYVFDLDDINAYYDVNLKYARLNELGIDPANAEVFNELCSSRFHRLQMQFIRMNLEALILLTEWKEFRSPDSMKLSQN
jgi:UDP-glucuronate 4-epimerase